MVKGHHHISMITKNGQSNNDFYTKVLGLRRVMMTVNQDSPDMYHLFFGDKTGAPGTELTFFEIPMSGMTHRGTNSISRIGLFVPTLESIQYWVARFDELQVKHTGIGNYAGRNAVLFEDHEGLRMVLIEHDGSALPSAWEQWEDSPVPAEHRILGMGPIEITVLKPEKTIHLLEAVFQYKIVEETDEWTRIQTDEGGQYSEIVIVQQDGPSERPGRGSVHHLALRARDVKQLLEWDEAIYSQGILTSGEVDRHFFQSVYFRDGNGILFEIATDEPGFVKDGDLENLGKQLDLPPKLEPHRKEIEAKLTPIV